MGQPLSRPICTVEPRSMSNISVSKPSSLPSSALNSQPDQVTSSKADASSVSATTEGLRTASQLNGVSTNGASTVESRPSVASAIELDVSPSAAKPSEDDKSMATHSADISMEHTVSIEAPTSGLREKPEPSTNPVLTKDSVASGSASSVQEPQSPISPPQERPAEIVQHIDNDTTMSDLGPTPPQSSRAVSPNPPVDTTPAEKSQAAEQDVPSSSIPTESTPNGGSKHEHPGDDSSQPAAKRSRLDGGSGASSPAVTFREPDLARKMTPNRQKHCLTVLRHLKRSKDSAPFLQPVDPVKLQIPDYPKIVTDPQDLGTIESKLKRNDYDTIDDFIDAVQLVWSNCQRYNGPEAPVNLMALRLKESFERQIRSMPEAEAAATPIGKGNKNKKTGKPSPAPSSVRPRKASSPAVIGGVPNIRRESLGVDGRPKREIHAPPPKSLPYQLAPQRRNKNAAQLKFCQTILKELTHKKHAGFAFPFYQPVDAVALGLHDYHTVIKTPMDLATMQSKLNAGDYESADDFEYDVRLMFRNCFKYNPPGQPVNTMGKRLQSIFDEKWAEKPVPRAQGYGSDSEDDSDIDDSSKQKVQMLTKQLEAMKDQIASMKKKKKPKRDRYDDDDDCGMGPGGNKKSSKRKNLDLDDVDESPMILSFEQKTALSTRMGYMSEHQMPVVVQILKKYDPKFDPEDEEIELDVDNVHPKALRLLWNWIMEDIQPSYLRKKAAPKQSKNRKVLSESEQQRQIEQLQAQLNRIEGGDGDGYNSRYAAGNDAASDSESNASSEEDD